MPIRENSINVFLITYLLLYICFVLFCGIKFEKNKPVRLSAFKYDTGLSDWVRYLPIQSSISIARATVSPSANCRRYNELGIFHNKSYFLWKTTLLRVRLKQWAHLAIGSDFF